MEEAASAVFAASAATPGPAREVHRDPKPGALSDVSRDGRFGLFQRFPNNSENYVVRLDLRSGAARTLYPEGGKVTVNDARFSPDGKTVYVATDGGGEQAWLLALDAETGKEKARYVETSPVLAAIDTVVVAKTGDSLALLIDAGNHHEVRLLDARTLKPKAKVPMPLGQGSLSAFSEDGSGRRRARRSTPGPSTRRPVTPRR